MAIKLVTKTQHGTPGGVAQYWHRLERIAGQQGIGIDWIMLDQWKAGHATAQPGRDLIIVDNQDALHIQGEYGVIATQHGCAMEHGLRDRSQPHIRMGEQQMAAAQRARTFWVACSDWAAHHCRLHMGVEADRIVYGAVDTDTYIPSERQRRRDARKPVVLHHCTDSNKGKHLIAGVANALGNGYEVRELHCAPEAVPDAMRDADIWLCLSASEGLPTVVMEAISCGLVVVGTNVGVLWPYTCGTPLAEGRFVSWLNKQLGAVVFDWQQRDYPEVVADHVRSAWRHRKELVGGRAFARQFWSLETFGRKWLEAIQLAAQRFRIAVSGAPARAPVPAGAGRPGERR